MNLKAIRVQSARLKDQTFKAFLSSFNKAGDLFRKGQSRVLSVMFSLYKAELDRLVSDSPNSSYGGYAGIMNGSS